MAAVKDFPSGLIEALSQADREARDAVNAGLHQFPFFFRRAVKFYRQKDLPRAYTWFQYASEVPAPEDAAQKAADVAQLLWVRLVEGAVKGVQA